MTMTDVDVLDALDVLDVAELVEGLDASSAFSRPAFVWFLAIDGGLAVLAVLALNRGAYEQARDIVPLPEQSQLKAILAGAVALHIAEAAVARRMARRRGVPSGRWVRQTLVVGFPSLRTLRRIPIG